MRKPSVLVLSGYGLNCEAETLYAFKLAGADGKIVHLNDVVDQPKQLRDFQIVALPGGFCYGDDTGSGNAYAHRMRNNCWRELFRFIRDSKLMIGICNGFQILSRLGLVPGVEGKYGEQQIALVHNTRARYIDRWVDLKVESDSPWFANIKTLSLPIAHGEGKFDTNERTLKKIQAKKLIACRYYEGEVCQHFGLEDNPNGSLENIAGITDETGRVLGLMPHPERAMFFTQLPHWPWLKEKYLREGLEVPEFGTGLTMFHNAVMYFS